MNQRQARFLWLVWCVVYLAAVTLALGLHTPYPGDEQRFIETGRLFANGVSLDLLRHYPEMSGPLPFLLFGAWGKIFGDSLAAMRGFSLLVAFATLLLLHRLASLVCATPAAALLASIVLCLNPYMATMSLFVYTDMLALLFTLAAVDSALRGWPAVMALSLAAAAISRQYLIFVTAALMTFFLIQWLWKKDSSSPRMLAAATISLLPLAGLAILWRGLAPDSWMRGYYVTGAPHYRLSSFTGYVAQLPIYLAPFVIFAGRALFRAKWLAVAAVAAAVYYPFFPIRAPERSAGIGIYTVGLVDRAVSHLLPSLWRDAFFGLAFVAGIAVAGRLLLDARSQWLARQASFPLLAGLVLAAFLMVMPWSYLYWEKYLLPVLPIAGLHLARLRASPENHGKI